MLSSWVFHRDGRIGRSWQLLSFAVGVLTLASGAVVAVGVVQGSDGLALRVGMFPALLWMTVLAARASRLATPIPGLRAVAAATTTSRTAGNGSPSLNAVHAVERVVPVSVARWAVRPDPRESAIEGRRDDGA